MKYYALRYDTGGINLHVFGSRSARNHWIDRVHKPPPTFGARVRISSDHPKVRDFYDEETDYHDHRTDYPIPNYVNPE